MSTIVNDTFTDANGTALTAHIGEVGATWTNSTATSYAGGSSAISSNKVTLSTSTAGGMQYASGVPLSADYSVQADFVFPTNAVGGVVGRSSTSAQQWYSFIANAGVFQINKDFTSVIGSSVTPSGGLSNSTIYRLTLAVSGTTINGTVQRLSDNLYLASNGTWGASVAICCTGTNSSYASAGKSGLAFITAGITVDNFLAFDGTGLSVIVPITDANLFFSPYGWTVSGSTYKQTTNPGAYLLTNFTGTHVYLDVDVTPLTGASVSASNYPSIAYCIDGGSLTRYQLVSTDTQISLATGLAAGTHTLEIILVGSWWQTDRWTTPSEVLRITAIEIDNAAATVAPTLQTGRMIVYGDSVGEGYEALGVGVSVANQDAGQAWPLLLGRALGCEVGVVCFAGTGFTTAGGGNVPALTSTWDKYSNGVSRLSGGLFSPAPDYILCGMGENDSSGVQAAVQSLITSWRAAAPSAKFIFLSPANLNQATAIAAGVAASGDANTQWVTTGENLLGAASGATRWANDNHLSVRGHARFAAIIADLVILLGRTDPTTAIATLQTAVTAIKAKTDNLPAAPAAVSNIPTALQIDAQLTGSHGSGPWITGAGGTGSGARTVTVLVTDSLGVPIELARVRITTGINTFIASSDGNGHALFSLDDGTYTLAVTKGGRSYTPTVQVINADTSITAVLQAIVIPGATNPAQANAYLHTYDGQGNIAPNVPITFRLVALGAGDPGGRAIGNAPFTLISDATGLLTVALMRLATYTAQSQNGTPISFLVADASVFALPSILGRP